MEILTKITNLRGHVDMVIEQSMPTKSGVEYMHSTHFLRGTIINSTFARGS